MFNTKGSGTMCTSNQKTKKHKQSWRLVFGGTRTRIARLVKGSGREGAAVPKVKELVPAFDIVV
jgi:uncharacterized membrane protein